MNTNIGKIGFEKCLEYKYPVQLTYDGDKVTLDFAHNAHAMEICEELNMLTSEAIIHDPSGFYARLV